MVDLFMNLIQDLNVNKQYKDKICRMKSLRRAVQKRILYLNI